MTVLQRIDDALDAVTRVSLRELLNRQYLIKKLAALHQLHNKAPVTFVLEDIVQSDDVRVVDLLEDFDLVLQRLNVVFRHFLLRKDLDGEALASSPEFGSLDTGVGPTTYRAFNLIGFLDIAVS